MLTQGRIDEGIAFLEAVRPRWTDLNSFMVTHLWWHLALFYLSAGREADALAAYDEQVWAVAKDYSQDQIGAVSLLARLEIDGVAIGARWDELADHLETRANDVGQPFLSVQYLYGLARAGRPAADRLLAAIEATAIDPARQDRATWQHAALPLARGLIAHARGSYAEAADEIAEALPRLLRLGGSHAQRDLFDIILLDACIRAGQFVEAQQTLELRRAHDPDGVPINRRLAEVYRALGLPDEAAAAEARVRARLAR
jgi:tetratricopeptide (TPR) repeat protein